MKAIFRLETIWVTFQAGLTAGYELPFQDQPLLNGCYILGIEAFNDTVLELVPDQTVVTTDLSPYLLTLNEGSDERHRLVPCQSLFPPGNGGVWKEFTPFIADWQKSRVKYVGAAAVPALVAVPFTVHYARPEDFEAYKALCAQMGIEP